MSRDGGRKHAQSDALSNNDNNVCFLGPFYFYDRQRRRKTVNSRSKKGRLSRRGRYPEQPATLRRLHKERIVRKELGWVFQQSAHHTHHTTHPTFHTPPTCMFQQLAYHTHHTTHTTHSTHHLHVCFSKQHTTHHTHPTFHTTHPPHSTHHLHAHFS